MLRVMETLFLCLREPVHGEGRDYEFTISENESTILLFWVGPEYDFTILFNAGFVVEYDDPERGLLF